MRNALNREANHAEKKKTEVNKTQKEKEKPNASWEGKNKVQRKMTKWNVKKLV